MRRFGSEWILAFAWALGLSGCAANPRTVVDSESVATRSAEPARSAAEWAALDAAAVAQLEGGFRTRVGGSGTEVLESVSGNRVLLHTLQLGDPPVVARWFGEEWSREVNGTARGLAPDGLIATRQGATELPARTARSGDAVWRVRLTGPAGFPLGDFFGRWSHPPSGPSFEGWSRTGVRTPPRPGGGGGLWLPEARLRVEPVVGRWWIDDQPGPDAGGRVVWSRDSIPAALEPPQPDAAVPFWTALADRLDRRIQAGPVRLSGVPWEAAFAAAERVRAGEAGPGEAAAEVMGEVAR